MASLPAKNFRRLPRHRRRSAHGLAHNDRCNGGQFSGSAKLLLPLRRVKRRDRKADGASAKPKLQLGDPVSKYISEFKGMKVGVMQEAGRSAADPPKFYT